MQPEVMILLLSRTLSPPGLTKIFGRPVYLNWMTNIHAALSMMSVGSYYVLLSGTGIATGESQPSFANPILNANAWTV